MERDPALTVVQISDTHLCREATDRADGPDRQLDRAIDLAVECAPDLVLLTGDIADDGSEEACRRVRTAIDRLGAPILAVPGNHDCRDAVRSVFGPSDELVAGGWRILLADTFVPDRISGRVDADALLRRLGPDSDRPTLLALHHPPIGTSTKEWFVLEGGDALVAGLSGRSDVRIVASGHLHQAFNVVSAGISYIGCSSTWYSLAHRNEEYRPDGGHVGATAYRLHPDGKWEWWRLPGE